MRFRLGALLCLSGLAACSNTTSETAKDPSYVHESAEVTTEPALTPASLEATQPPTATASNEPSAPVVVEPNGTHGAPSSPAPLAEATPVRSPSPAAAPDNTKVNQRDTSSAALTPLDQKENQTDLKITQNIRQAVMADGALSFTAKNVKIITQNGKVTLRGPVNTAEERSAIEAAARKVAGATQVDNQLEVKK